MDYIEYTNDTHDLNESLEDFLLQDHEISDRELNKIYKYHQYGGYRNIKFLELTNLSSTIFMIFFIQVIFRCTDYTGLGDINNQLEVNQESKYIWDYIDLRKMWGTSFFNICFLIIFGVYIFLRILTILDGLRQYRGVKKYLHNKLNLLDRDLEKMKWSQICDRLETILHLNSYEIHAKMLRKENISIHIFDSAINKFVFSKLMEWNLTFCIINPILNNLCHNKLDYMDSADEREEDTSEFLQSDLKISSKSNIKFMYKSKIKSKCVFNLVVLAYLTFIFMPFLIIYSFFFTFLKYAERYYHDPSKIALRHWSLASHWKIRYYNELPHLLEERLSKSGKYSKQYLDNFQNLILKYTCNFITLVCSSLFISLVILSVYNENILLHLHISKDKHVLWYLGILASIIAVARNISKGKNNLKYETDTYFRKIESVYPLLNTRRYNISKDKIKLDEEKKGILCQQYVYQFKTLLLECFSVLWVPFCLIYLANYVENIIEKIEKKINYDSRVGFITKSGNFRNLSKNSNLKTLLSFKEFRNNFPAWGANIEIYKLGEMSFLKPEKLDANSQEENLDYKKVGNRKPQESIFNTSLKSGLSIL